MQSVNLIKPVFQHFLPSLSIGISDVITSPNMGPFFHDLKTAFDSGNMNEAAKIQVRLLWQPICLKGSLKVYVQLLKMCMDKSWQFCTGFMCCTFPMKEAEK